MVYAKNFVVALKSDGKIIRDSNGYIELPFGSEYSILLKNLNSRKALVDISIDGKDVLDGSRIVVESNETTELKGFKKDSKVENSFKFIQKTKEISKHRGDRIDDGIIRVEVTYEAEQIELPSIVRKPTYWDWPWNSQDWFSSPDIYVNGVSTYYTSDGVVSDQNCTYFSNYTNSTSNNMDANTHRCCSDSSDTCETSKECTVSQTDGITVKGSKTHQKFYKTNVNILEKQSTVIVLRLVGRTEDNVKIKEPTFIKTKLECETCGRKSVSTAKFCSNCGTKL